MRYEWSAEYRHGGVYRSFQGPTPESSHTGRHTPARGRAKPWDTGHPGGLLM